MREGEYYGRRRGRREGGAITTHSRACGLRGVAFCPSSLLPFPERKTHVGARIFRIVVRMCARIHARDTRAPYKRNRLFDLRGENNPTSSSDSRMRADERRSPTEDPRGCSNTRVSGRLACTRAPPFRSLLLLRFNEMLRPLARDYFPIAPINSPFGRSRLSRGGTRGHLSSLTIPGAAASTEDFCTLLKGIRYRESLIDFHVFEYP